MGVVQRRNFCKRSIMKKLERFLPGMNQRGFGRGPKSALAQMQLKAEQLSRSSLSELSQVFGCFFSDALLEPTAKREHSRRRIYSLRTTFWAFLSQVLSPRTACLEVVRKIQSYCSEQGLDIPSGSDSAYTQARGRLPTDRLKQAFEEVRNKLEQQCRESWKWHGRSVRVIDGTGITLADTPENQAVYPQPAEQRRGCGFPVMQVVGCFCLHTGALLHWVSGKLAEHESPLLKRLLPMLHEGEIILTDRGFSSYSNLALCQQQGLDAVMRLHQARQIDLRQGKRLGKEDRLVVWERPQIQKGWTRQQWNALPGAIAVRLLRLNIQNRGFRPQQLVIVTTLTDPKIYTREDLADLYYQRWQVELYFRDIKTSMQMEQLRCKKPDGVEKEMIMFAIAYNLLRLLIVHAACQYHLLPRQISFKAAADTLRHYRQAFRASKGKPREVDRLWREMLEVITHKIVGNRPNRSEPRAVKKRPKNYQRMTTYRSKMKVAKSRRNKGQNRRKTTLT